MASLSRLTAVQCVELIESETGSVIAPATFRVYAHRGQAPAPVERIGRTPLWRRSAVLEWAHNRPGVGARTDLDGTAAHRRSRRA